MKKGFLNNNNSKKKKSNKNSGSSSKAMDETTESMKTLNVTESNNNNNKNNNVKQKVPYTIEDLGNDRVKAVFTVPEEAVAALSAKGAVMYIRGGSFQMLKSNGSTNTVYTIFESVLPSMTCDAIAERIQFRIDNPNSPGMEMLCSIQ